jgi:large subunit ribosomal protein L22
MEARAYLKGARISPKKAREVITFIKGKSVEKALVMLKFSPRKASFIIRKLLQSALSNAENTGIDIDKLYISKIVADDGFKMKRFKPRARGRAGRIVKRASNLEIELSER